MSIKKLMIVGATPVILVLVTVGAGPKWSRSSECLFCGLHRYETWKWGVKVADRVEMTEASAWVDGLHPGHSGHLWSTTSETRKGWGFGATTISCGGIGGIANIHYLRARCGEDCARELLDKYHLQLKTDRSGLWKFVRTEVVALSLTNAP